jgi:hypothetical protein
LIGIICLLPTGGSAPLHRDPQLEARGLERAAFDEVGISGNRRRRPDKEALQLVAALPPQKDPFASVSTPSAMTFAP